MPCHVCIIDNSYKISHFLRKPNDFRIFWTLPRLLLRVKLLFMWLRNGQAIHKMSCTITLKHKLMVLFDIENMKKFTFLPQIVKFRGLRGNLYAISKILKKNHSECYPQRNSLRHGEHDFLKKIFFLTRPNVDVHKNCVLSDERRSRWNLPVRSAPRT